MKKILELQRALLRKIDEAEKNDPPGFVRDQSMDWERLHLASSARIAYILAENRGVDPILAAIACSCHDYGRILTGRQAGHSEAGYLPVKDFLRSLAMFDEAEIEEIALAVRNHSNKSEIGTPIEEIVKDADVLDFHQYGYEMPRAEQQARLCALLQL